MNTVQPATKIEKEQFIQAEKHQKTGFESVPTKKLLDAMEITHAQVARLRNGVIHNEVGPEDRDVYTRSKKALSIAEIELLTRVVERSSERSAFIDYFLQKIDFVSEDFKAKLLRYQLLAGVMAMFDRSPENTLLRPSFMQFNNLNISFYVHRAGSPKITPIIVVTETGDIPLLAYAHDGVKRMPISLPRQIQTLPILPSETLQVRYAKAALFTQRHSDVFTPPVLLMVNQSAVVFEDGIMGIKPDECFMGMKRCDVLEYPELYDLE